MTKELIIWCDESVKKGKYYSNFYGGVLIESTHQKEVLAKLEAVVNQLGLTDEIKWQKVNEFHLEKYLQLMDVFFQIVASGKIKVRIMFTQNANIATNLLSHHIDNEYFLLYYQFFKHAFGLKHANNGNRPVYIRAYFDELPDQIARRHQFKEYIKGLESTRDFQLSKLKIRKDDIAEVNSKSHLPLQFLDLVLGCMAYRLNDKHKEKPSGKKRRGKRTIAKEKLYKHICSKIRGIKPRFNIGISTGTSELEDRWTMPYRHWLFVPKEFETDGNSYK